MAGVLLSREPAPIAPSSVAIDYGHPLAAGLVMFVPMWLGRSAPNGPLYGRGALDSVTSFAPLGVTVGVSGGANVGYKADPSPASGAALPQASWAVYANITGQAGDFAGLFMARNSGGLGMHSRSTGPSLSLNWNTADATYNTLIQAYDLNRWQVLGVSARVGVMTGASGKGVTSTATNAPTAQSAAFTPLDWRVGQDVFATTRTVQGTYAWAAMWRRYLSASEWAWLNAEPYAFLQPRRGRQRYWLLAGPSVAATATGSLSLAASATAAAPVTGTAALTLASAGTSGAAISAAATVTLTSTGTAVARLTGTGALALTATVTVGTQATGAGAVTLAAAATVAAPSTGMGQLALTAVATPTARTTATAVLTLAATATARGLATATAQISLLGAALLRPLRNITLISSRLASRWTGRDTGRRFTSTSVPPDITSRRLP